MTTSTSAGRFGTVSRDHRAFLNEIALQDFDALTKLTAGFEMGERLLFYGLVSKAFDMIALRCDEPILLTETACTARYKLFEFLRSYKDLRGVGTRSLEAGR